MINKKNCSAFFSLIITMVFILLFLTSSFAFAQGDTTYIIPIDGEINNGNLLFIQRAYADAVLNDAGAIIFDIDTYGGEVDTAIKIKDLIMSSQLPTVCFVDNKAISAGSLIALAGEKLVMRPGTTIGAAEPRIGSEKADEKVVSMWSAELNSTAEARGRNGEIAAAMADSDIVIPGLVEKDKLLTLGDQQALSYDMIDDVLNNVDEIVDEYDLPDNLVTIEKTFRERIVGLISSPYIAAILLTVGIAGIIIEIFTAGFGIFGTVGLLAFVTFFVGNMWAGNGGWGPILFLALGIFLIAMEIFVIPGFGVPGILGALSVLFSIFLVSPSLEYAVIAILISLVASILLIVISIKNRKTRAVWNKFILSQKQEKATGYNAPSVELAEYVGKEGVALTTLRPAGAVEIDGKRIDAVTEGDFIKIGAKISVLKVEGVRVVVKEIK